MQMEFLNCNNLSAFASFHHRRSSSCGSSVTEDYFDVASRSFYEDRAYFPGVWTEEEMKQHYTTYAQEHSVWHMKLLMDAGRTDELRYIAMPKDTTNDTKFSGTAVPPNYGYRLFVGQVKREITAFQLRYLLRAATGVTPRMVRAKEGRMCWLVVVDSHEDFVQILSKNRSILCDMEGAFVDETGDSQILRTYCAALQQQALSYGRSYVLPRNAIVIEQEGERHNPRSPNKAPVSSRC